MKLLSLIWILDSINFIQKMIAFWNPYEPPGTQFVVSGMSLSDCTNQFVVWCWIHAKYQWGLKVEAWVVNSLEALISRGCFCVDPCVFLHPCTAEGQNGHGKCKPPPIFLCLCAHHAQTDNRLMDECRHILQSKMSEEPQQTAAGTERPRSVARFPHWSARRH